MSLVDKVFLYKVKQTLKASMLEYIPLDLLTDKACWQAARKPSDPESTFIISNRKLCLLNTTFDVTKKSKLLFDD